jgi:hypothetical protein
LRRLEVPAGHKRHASTEEEPKEGLYVPDGQALGKPCRQYLPLGHGTPDDNTLWDSQSTPSRQRPLHVAAESPEVFPKCPGGQLCAWPAGWSHSTGTHSTTSTNARAVACVAQSQFSATTHAPHEPIPHFQPWNHPQFSHPPPHTHTRPHAHATTCVPSPGQWKHTHTTTCTRHPLRTITRTVETHAHNHMQTPPPAYHHPDSRNTRTQPHAHATPCVPSPGQWKHTHTTTCTRHPLRTITRTVGAGTTGLHGGAAAGSPVCEEARPRSQGHP